LRFMRMKTRSQEQWQKPRDIPGMYSHPEIPFSS
jgi:hypothetical protein